MTSVPRACFVAVHDVIAFKALRARRGTAGLHQLYERGILPAVQHSAAGRGKTITVGGTAVHVPDFNSNSVGLKIFSDTVVFHTPNDTFESFLALVNATFMLLQFGFAGGKYPLRGAIGHGDLIEDGTFIMVGTALEDAYACEQSQMWAGAMLTPNCTRFAQERGYIEKFAQVHQESAKGETDPHKQEHIKQNSRRLVRFDVPLQRTVKPGPTTYEKAAAYVIDWTIRMYEGAADKSFEASDNEHARSIAENTRAFEQWARKHNR